MKASLILSLAGHSLVVIGFVLLLYYICFHRWDRNVVVIRAI